MSDQTIYEPIPQPPGYPVLGNVFDVRGAETPIQALMKLARASTGRSFSYTWVLSAGAGFDQPPRRCR